MALGTNATTMSQFGDEGVLPTPMATDIMRNAYGQSIIGQVSGTTPMPITGTSIAMQTGDPVAGIVGEGELKPVIKTGVTTKVARPIKAAAMVYWSTEARRANPLGYLDMLEKTAVDAIAKAIDMAVIHGKNALNDADLSGVEFLTQSANSVDLGTSTAASGGLSEDILVGYEAVDTAGGDMSGFLADSSMRLKLMRERDVNGNPIYGTDASGAVDLRSPMGILHGLPVTYGRAVKGQIGTVADTGVRLIGGAFKDNLKFGYVDQISYRRSTEATIVDGGTEVYLFQQNMEAFLVEAMFGWIIGDVDQFAIYRDPAVADAGA